MLSKFKGIALSAVLAVAVAGMAHAQEELKIGGIGPLSGGGTAWGLAVQRGTELAIEEVVKAGGLKVGGKTYIPKLTMFDDQFTAAGGRLAADRLVNAEKVKFIIGPIGSAPVLAAIAVTTPAQVLVFSNGFNPAILKNEAKSPYNFRGAVSTVEYGPAMVKWLKANYPNIKKVGMLAPNDATGQAAVPQLTAYYKAVGIDVWFEYFDRGSKEFTPLITRMMAQGIDLFDLSINSPGDGGLMVKQARQTGYKGVIWQAGGPSVDEIIEIAGPLAEGFLSYNTFDFAQPQAKNFVKAFRAKYGDSLINGQTPIWYNATKNLFEAMRRAGSTDVTKVRDALEKLEGYDAGLFGPVQWGGTADYGVAHQLLLKFWITEVKGGKGVTRAALSPEKK
jgi:branched-chain amino acid transport system substrate-binding protein